MRINLASTRKGGRDPRVTDLLNQLGQPFADEYAMSLDSALRYLFSPDHMTREIVANYLRTQDWKIQTYNLPPAADGVIHSWGYFIADDCDQLIQWLLSQS